MRMLSLKCQFCNTTIYGKDADHLQKVASYHEEWHMRTDEKALKGVRRGI